MRDGGTAGAWIALAAARLSASGVDRARAEARALLAAAAGVDPGRLFAYPEMAIAGANAAAADALLARRAAGEPLSRILGEREFWSLQFRLGPDVLDPRADTEIVVEAALALLADRKAPQVLDLGLGSGCILAALLSERQDAIGVGVDRSLGAIGVARDNLRRLGLAGRAAVFVGDWGSALAPGLFDLIVANPPYIAETDGPAPDAATEGFDPPLALWAGPDGLAAYRRILPDLPRLLAPGGAAVLEIGVAQRAAVEALGEAAGLRLIASRADLAGHMRALAFLAK